MEKRKDSDFGGKVSIKQIVKATISLGEKHLGVIHPEDIAVEIYNLYDGLEIKKDTVSRYLPDVKPRLPAELAARVAIKDQITNLQIYEVIGFLVNAGTFCISMEMIVGELKSLTGKIISAKQLQYVRLKNINLPKEWEQRLIFGNDKVSPYLMFRAIENLIEKLGKDSKKLISSPMISKEIKEISGISITPAAVRKRLQSLDIPDRLKKRIAMFTDSKQKQGISEGIVSSFAFMPFLGASLSVGVAIFSLLLIVGLSRLHRSQLEDLLDWLETKENSPPAKSSAWLLRLLLNIIPGGRQVQSLSQNPASRCRYWGCKRGRRAGSNLHRKENTGTYSGRSEPRPGWGCTRMPGHRSAPCSQPPIWRPDRIPRSWGCCWRPP